MSKGGKITQLFRVAPGEHVLGTGDEAAQDHFLSEVKYADHYAKLIGQALSMKAVRIASVEDSVGQVAFSYMTGPSGQSTVNGIMTGRPRSLRGVLAEFTEED
jgi:hypothetical protein